MYKNYIKRLFDLIIGIIAFPFVLIAIIIMSPIIYFDDRGPIFYNAPRIGYKGKVFKMYKFRSMKVNSPNIVNADGSTYNGENDPRVTRIGRIMRKLSIDEIPQFLNIMNGTMSLIGPRAHLTTHYKGYEYLDEDHKKRLEVRPGITGYNQAYFRNSVDSAQKIKNDVYYVENLTFIMDVKVFFKTIESVLLRKNIFVDQSGAKKISDTGVEVDVSERSK